MDFAHTKKFLHYLDPDANEFTFQTYGEGQASNKYFLNSTFSNAFEDVKHHLLKLNGNGAGISVTVNETDGSGKRTIHNIVRVRAVWQDDDSGYEGDYPLEPSMEVESSPGRFHRYWIIDPSDPLSPSDFIKVMKVMVDQYGSDPNCKDLSRVLRLPGSYHMKTGYPFLVSLVGGNGRRYKGHEIKEAFLQQEAASSQQATFASSGELPLIPIEAPKPKPIEIEDTFTERELSKADLKKLKEALEFIPPESRGTWLEVGFALFDAFQGREKGFDIWDKWSQGTRAKNYNGAHQMRSWYGEFHKRTGRENRVGLGTIYRLAMENGWEPKESYETEPEFKYEKVKAAPGELTNKTMGALRKSFVEYGHYPSQPQLVGLNDLVNHLESMANGTAEKHFFLSSLDPGVGKTQSISHFTKKLLESKAHDSVAILFCLGRLSEIRNIVTDMGLEEDQYAVFVTDIEANRDLLDMGNQDPSKARVLFTTQQMLESRIKRTGSFEQAKDFHYLGKPRQVRLWDEACLPARPFTVNLYGIKKLLEEANKRYEIPALHDTLKKLANELEQQEDGSIFDIPALDEIVPQNRALSIYREESPATRNLVRDLWLLSGKSVYIRKQGNENVIAHYENTLPDDLKPIVICDASGRVRKTYKHWSDGRDDLIALQYGPKSYKPLTIHLWERGGGKAAWKDHYKTLVEGIVATVNQKPNELFLILYHMKSSRFDIDIPKMIREKAINPERLFFAHWGGDEYRATNKYKDVTNVILAGTLFYDQGHYDALLRLSRGIEPDKKLNAEHLKQIEKGEHAQMMLQAVCRAAVRKSIGGQCGECDAYIIANPNTGIPKMLKDGDIFPNATVIPWNPVEQEEKEKELAGKAKEAFDFIVSKVSQGKVTSSEVMEAIKMEGKGNFNRLISRGDLRDTLSKESIELVKARGRGAQSYFMKMDNTKETPWSGKDESVNALPF